MKLTGKRVTLRTLELNDVPVLYDLIYTVEKPEWKNYDAPYFPLEPCTLEKFYERMDKRMNFTDVPNALIIEHNGEIIGDVSFYWEHQATRWLEVGIVIYSSNHWSGGFGTEALTLWIDYLFSQLEIGRVGLTTWSGNPRMMRCAEKLGMQLEGRMRRCRYYDGVYYDSIRMGILREEWEAHKYKSN
ncbi:GNAT family N-acetyltransferase [Bacillus sp. CGMCC 1.16607]|uniref:GNAT family N-acetyltransferase n=1 Tax=Bacillus sp. CGMCC 1.16607 TaxID=3351842 RepID=UPI003635FAF8